MSRKQLIEMARRNMAHVKAGTVDQADDVLRVPASNYYDPDRWQIEMDRLSVTLAHAPSPFIFLISSTSPLVRSNHSPLIHLSS